MLHRAGQAVKGKKTKSVVTDDSEEVDSQLSFAESEINVRKPLRTIKQIEIILSNRLFSPIFLYC